jgi:DNA-binding GntR family transcriptional regulator
MLNAPRRRTAADEAEHALFQGIMDGAIPPGAPLRLQDLADQLDMSMMPIREALRRLQGLGLVEIVAHKGAWVRPLTVEDLYDTYFTRMHLEALALATAARRMTVEAADQARAALEEKRAADARGDLLASRDAHERFHFALYDESGSEWLVRSIWPVWRNSERYRVESMRDPVHARQRALEHDGMLDALEAGDGDEAVRLLHRHLRSSVDLVASHLPAGAAEPRVELPDVADLVSGGRAA